MSQIQGPNNYIANKQFGVDFPGIIKQLNSANGRIDGLDQLQQALNSTDTNNSAYFMGQMDQLFFGLRSCLTTQECNDQQEILMKTNQILFDMMADIQSQPQLEVQISQLIPLFIINLGNPKAIVRKSTHKCIGTYVKYSKKLEYVLLHITHTGLENQTSRTRQHSMLVIPALLSLKAQVIEKSSNELLMLLQTVIKKLKDPSEIVAKTAKKLILELNKCYPETFVNHVIKRLPNENDRYICDLILNNQLDELTLALSVDNNQQKPQQNQQQQQQQRNQHSASDLANNQERQDHQQININQRTVPQVKSQLINRDHQQRGDLSIYGREIMQSNQNHALLVQNNTVEPNDLDKIVVENKPEQTGKINQKPGLAFGFIEEKYINALNDNNQWKERTNAMEVIESQINDTLYSDKKRDFAPYATAFLGFLYQLIPDINFKISLAAIKIITTLLSMNLVEIKKYYAQLVKNLIEKLSDSKIIIRNAILKCCSYIIENYKASQFAFLSIPYLQHSNWHVRESTLHLIAHCLLAQKEVPREQHGARGDEAIEALQVYGEPTLSLNKTLIEELCMLTKVEDKKKLQLMVIDVLALAIDSSVNQGKTDQMIKKEFGLDRRNDMKQQTVTKESQYQKQILERIASQQLPYLNEENFVEFSTATPSSSTHNSILLNQNQSLSPRANANTSVNYQSPTSMKQQVQSDPSNMFAQNNKTPSSNFIEAKKREEEKRQKVETAQAVQSDQAQFQIQTDQPQYPLSADIVKQKKGNDQNNVTPQVTDKKVAMWLPSFTPVPNSELKSSQNNSQIISQQDTMRKSNNTINALTSSQNAHHQQQQMIHQQQHPSQRHSVPQHNNIVNKSVRTIIQNNNGNPVVLPHSGGNLNATASSSATFVDDGRSSSITATTLVSSAQLQNMANKNKDNSHQGTRSPIYSDTNKTTSDGGSNFRAAFGQSHNSISAVNQGHCTNGAISTGNGGYTPETHLNKPRNIQSNQDKQRLMGQTNPAIQGMSQSSGANGFDQNQVNDRLALLKSTAKYKTKFDQNSAHENNQVNHHVSLENGSQGGLSNNFGATANFSEDAKKNNPHHFQNHLNQNRRGGGPVKAAHLTIPSEEVKDVQKIQQQNNPNRIIMKQASAPVTMHTPHQYDNSQNQHLQQQPQQQYPPQAATTTTNNIHTNKRGTHAGNMLSQSNGKPPITSVTSSRASNTNFYDEFSQQNGSQDMIVSKTEKKSHSRAPHESTNMQPVISQFSNTKNMNSSRKASSSQGLATGKANSGSIRDIGSGLQSNLGGEQKDIYDFVEEPLAHPDMQLKQSLENLKSNDWQKQFDACNTLKRLFMFHKHLFTSSSQVSQMLKDLVKPVDSLRSQVSKNASIAVQYCFEELEVKILDPNIDIIMPVLFKRACDTNAFISEAAERTLISICLHCSDLKVFHSVQNQNMRSNLMKGRACMCYNSIIEKMGPRIKNFREVDRLVQQICTMLNESAAEVRNSAKVAIITLKNNFSTDRDFELLLQKCHLNERQFEKIHKVIETTDSEQLSNYANTRYGHSMRGTHLDATISDQRGRLNSNANDSAGGKRQQHILYGGGSASGSDGFNKFTKNAQQTFLSGGHNNANQTSTSQVNSYHISHGSSSGFDMTGNNIFKKRNTSVSKPVDPQLMEEFQQILQACGINDWNKRLKAIEELQQFINSHQTAIKQASSSKFIQLMDVYCKLLQDNNAKVQARAQIGFAQVLQNQNMHQLIDQSLTMIVQALTSNLASSSAAVKKEGDHLFNLLEAAVVQESRGNANHLVQPMVNQVNQTNNRAKAQLVERLAHMVERVDKLNLIERYLNTLLQPNNKIWQEANGNPKLKESLKMLEQSVQNAILGFNQMGISSKHAN